MNVQDFFGWSATFLTAGFYISLITPFFKVFKGNLSYQNTPIVVIIISYVNCITWVIYGRMISSIQIKVCNMVGGISTFILIFLYLSYHIRKYLQDSIIYICILLIGSYLFYLFLTEILNNAKIIGKMCVFAKFFVFISPVQLIYRVIKEKNYILIPIFASFVSFLSCICWILYGFLKEDINVVIPNTIGLILALVQFYVYSFYKIKYQKIIEQSPTNTIDVEKNILKGNKDNDSNDKKKKKNQGIVQKPIKISSKIES